MEALRKAQNPVLRQDFAGYRVKVTVTPPEPNVGNATYVLHLRTITPNGRHPRMPAAAASDPKEAAGAPESVRVGAHAPYTPIDGE